MYLIYIELFICCRANVPRNMFTRECLPMTHVTHTKVCLWMYSNFLQLARAISPNLLIFRLQWFWWLWIILICRRTEPDPNSKFSRYPVPASDLRSGYPLHIIENSASQGTELINNIIAGKNTYFFIIIYYHCLQGRRKRVRRGRNFIAFALIAIFISFQRKKEFWKSLIWNSFVLKTHCSIHKVCLQFFLGEMIH